MVIGHRSELGTGMSREPKSRGSLLMDSRGWSPTGALKTTLVALRNDVNCTLTRRTANGASLPLIVTDSATFALRWLIEEGPLLAIDAAPGEKKLSCTG